MRIPRRAVAIALAAGTALAAFGGVGSAAASPHHLAPVYTFEDSYGAPLQFAVDGKKIYVADSGASALYRLGNPTPIATGFPPTTNPEASGDVAGVDARDGMVAYTTTKGDHSKAYFIVLQHGKRILKVDLAKYEKHHNPDGRNRYGVVNPEKLTDACSAIIAAGTGHDPVYRGAIDSHPYAVKGLKDGSWLVADAGGNDIVRVSRYGHVSTFAVLPAQPAIDLGALDPACAGVRYRWEPVPTDVELGPKGVYVSTLPGGAGALGSVYTIGWNGHPHRLATGFPSATNIAVTPSGTVYVAELGTGVAKAWHGGAKQLSDPAGPLAAVVGLEWAHGKLFASTAPAVLGGDPATSPGKIHILG